MAENNKRKASCLLGRVLDRLAGTAVSAEALEAVASALAKVDDPSAWRSFRDVAHRCSNQKRAFATCVTVLLEPLLELGGCEATREVAVEAAAVFFGDEHLAAFKDWLCGGDAKPATENKRKRRKPSNGDGEQKKPQSYVASLMEALEKSELVAGFPAVFEALLKSAFNKRREYSALVWAVFWRFEALMNGSAAARRTMVLALADAVDADGVSLESHEDAAKINVLTEALLRGGSVVEVETAAGFLRLYREAAPLSLIIEANNETLARSAAGAWVRWDVGVLLAAVTAADAVMLDALARELKNAELSPNEVEALFQADPAVLEKCLAKGGPRVGARNAPLLIEKCQMDGSLRLRLLLSGLRDRAATFIGAETAEDEDLKLLAIALREQPRDPALALVAARLVSPRRPALLTFCLKTRNEDVYALLVQQKLWALAAASEADLDGLARWVVESDAALKDASLYESAALGRAIASRVAENDPRLLRLLTAAPREWLPPDAWLVIARHCSSNSTEDHERLLRAAALRSGCPSELDSRVLQRAAAETGGEALKTIRTLVSKMPAERVQAWLQKAQSMQLKTAIAGGLRSAPALALELCAGDDDAKAAGLCLLDDDQLRRSIVESATSKLLVKAAVKCAAEHYPTDEKLIVSLCLKCDLKSLKLLLTSCSDAAYAAMLRAPKTEALVRVLVVALDRQHRRELPVDMMLLIKELLAAENSAAKFAALRAAVLASHRQIRLTQLSCAALIGCAARYTASATDPDAVCNALALVSIVVAKHPRRAKELSPLVVAPARDALGLIESPKVATALARLLEQMADVEKGQFTGLPISALVLLSDFAKMMPLPLNDGLKWLRAVEALKSSLRRIAGLAPHADLQRTHSKLTTNQDKQSFSLLFQKLDHSPYGTL